ncbi:S-methyl-5'-thioadenosine phosphorylase [Candidatus Persebacteraceae bacterium Df01]|jgi:5'-methylthioadenosine phosphorylase|uniref:Purine nucleoside phosphorylase n=1 Tax=Candidatus Doriopsillibacter californiensis TaxID=2970740 RepID=A0ABT7QL50_9GAMM|nr:S-methyl-5'-thioadenosine phosphorylase [Candidatus Persebacteraceae bacterium Df01]
MLAIIGGSGFYQMENFAVVERRDVDTPYGKPSAPLTVVECHGQQVFFLPRHGDAHTLLPSDINYRANIWALKQAGARQVIAVSASGSLREALRPGDFVVPSQYFDHTKGTRARTFFGDGLVGHISTAHPVCPELSSALATACRDCGHTVHENSTYACVEGPRLGTRCESFFLRDSVKADIVGMTNVPEVFLALEAQLCYATLALVTDYDCWMDDPTHHVTVDIVIQRFSESISRARDVVSRLLAAPPPVNEEHRQSASKAILTPSAVRKQQHEILLKTLLV